jgi:hypothetical protein
MGNFCEGICKSQKGAKKSEMSPEDKEKFQAKLDEMMGIKKVEDLIQKNGLTKMFDSYVD